MSKYVQKLYAYVDESGQDTSSNFFVVVAVVTVAEQAQLRKALADIERTARTGHKKWHKLRHSNRMHYLSLIVEKEIAAGNVYYAHYKKRLNGQNGVVNLLTR